VLWQRDLERVRDELGNQLRAIMLVLAHIDRKLEELLDDEGWDDEEEADA
jgi:hypothetical protein